MVQVPEFPIDFGARKVVKSGSSLLISLPIVMVRTAKLSAGDRLNVSMSVTGKLLISPIDQE